MPRKLSNIELNRLTPEQFRQAEKMPVTLVLDNIRSQHNIGAAFRTGDAFRIEKIILCGICAVPPGAEIHKAALGAEDAVSWEYAADTAAALAALRRNGYTPVAIEQTENAIPLQQFTPDGGKKYALVFGNEVRGVQQAVVDACDCAIEIPQAGTKHSLNVSVSIGIVLWRFFNGEWKMENVS